MKYCMFCGEQIPDEAIFCMKCGAKLPEQKEIDIDEEIIEEETDEEEDNIALGLLSKVNFGSKPSRTEPIIPIPTKVEKKSEKKIDKIQKIEKQDNDNNIIIKEYKPINKLKELKQEEPKLDEPKQEENYSKEKTLPELQEETENINNDGVYFDDEIPCAIDIDEELSNIDKILNKSENKTQSIIADMEEDLIKNEEIIEKPREDILNIKKKENTNIKKEKVVYKKRNLSEKDETEDEIQQNKINKDSSLNFSNMNDDLTEDEKADMEKYKKIKEENIDVNDSFDNDKKPKGEGRKSNGRKKEARKNIDKEIASRKINIIEHEEIEKKADIDPDYDGYYENVKPIDFDKQRDNSALIKVIITAAVFLILASSVFYLLITFFIK